MKRYSFSLTTRIFLITSALLITACAITYGAIAYLTPITYTSILQDELEHKSRGLIKSLEKITSEDSKTLLDDFARDTGAELMVWDDQGNLLYDTAVTSGTAYDVPDETVQNEQDDVVIASGTASLSDEAAQSEQIGSSSSTSSSERDEAQSCASSSSESEGTASVTEDTVATAVASEQGSQYPFLFVDGTNATMNVVGGVRAVNQAMEALGRVLPFLICVILLISLAGSFLYARYITRPIVSISLIARRIAALDFKARWTKHRGDEIGALGDSLNTLSDNLSEALGQLQSANQTLQRDIDHERELDRQRLAFFSAVSHELKTPVTILKGQLSGMLAQIGIYQDREKYLARALEVTGRMEGLVKEILTVSRIESGSFSLKPKPVNLSALMKKQLDLDSELLEQKSLTVEAHLRETTVQGNDQLLSKVLDSLLLNAMLYSPSGASVLIEVGNREFSIENTGASIPEESIAQLFTPFYRVEQSRNRKSGGSGLGLYLVKTILDRHGALCKIENTAQGVRFSAQFPQT